MEGRPYVKVVTSEDGKSHCTEYGTELTEEEYEEYLQQLETDYKQCVCGEYNSLDAKECWDCGMLLPGTYDCTSCGNTVEHYEFCHNCDTCSVCCDCYDIYEERI